LILAACNGGAGLRPAQRSAGVARPGVEQAEGFHRDKIHAWPVAFAAALALSGSSVASAALSPFHRPTQA